MFELFSKIDAIGSYVSRVELRRGLELRPLFSTLERLPPNLAIKWSDRLNPLESIACEWSLAQCYEKAFAVKVPKRGEHLRTIAAEVQRLIWIYSFLGNLFRFLGDQIRLQQALRLREFLLSSQEIFSGSRILPQVICIGGVERDLSLGEVRKIREAVLASSRELSRFFSSLDLDLLLQRRLTDLVPISQRFCKLARWTGLVGRASGYHFDLREVSPYGVYEKLQDQLTLCRMPGTEVRRSSDAWMRLSMALHLARGTQSLVLNALETLPEGPAVSDVSQVSHSIPHEGVFTAACEGASGLVVAVVTDGSVRIRTTSMRVQPVVEDLLVGTCLEDVEIALATLGYEAIDGDLRWE